MKPNSEESRSLVLSTCKLATAFFQYPAWLLGSRRSEKAIRPSSAHSKPKSWLSSSPRGTRRCYANGGFSRTGLEADLED